MDKKMTLLIGEKEVALNFGVNWFFEFYKSDSGHDLVKDPGLSLVDLQSTQLFDFIQSVIWAGYQADCSVNRVALVLTRDDVRHYVMSQTEAQASEMLWPLLSALSGVSVDDLKKVGEVDQKKNQ